MNTIINIFKIGIVFFLVHAALMFVHLGTTKIEETLSKRENYRIIEREGNFAVQKRFTAKYFKFWEFEWQEVTPSSFAFKTQERAEKYMNDRIKSYQEDLNYDGDDYKVVK